MFTQTALLSLLLTKSNFIVHNELHDLSEPHRCIQLVMLSSRAEPRQEA